MILAQSTTFIIGPIAQLLGVIISYIYSALEAIGIGNIAISIVLFTIIIQILMIPIKYKQQKFTRVQSIVTPQINAIRAKYNGKRDQQSMAMMNQEIKEVYANCGTSQIGGCLPMLIQMPILFALFDVIRNIPSYVGNLNILFTQVSDKIISSNGVQVLSQIKDVNIPKGLTEQDVVITYLYNFNISDWNNLIEKVANLPKNTIDSILDSMKFIGGVLVSDSPWSLLKQNNFLHWIWIIPVLVYISARFSMTTATTNNDDSPAGKQMKTMTAFMPIISVVFSIALPVGLGIYWIMNSVLMAIQQIFMNKYIDKKGMDNIIKNNIEKMKEKKEKEKIKSGVAPSSITKAANISTKNISNDEYKIKENTNQVPNSMGSIIDLTDKYKDE